MSRSLILTASAVLLLACSEAPPTSPGEVTTIPATPASAVSGTTLPAVMTGLNNPRELAWGPDGGLYVTEAGDAQVRGPCATTARGPNCYSGSGSISRWWHGRQERVASGLPSVVNTALTDVSGPQDIGFTGLGTGFVTLGWGGDPALRAALGGAGKLVGHLIQLTPGGVVLPVADISAVEATNPDGGFIDSNPYGLLVEAAHRWVTDAGGNSLLDVGANGAVSVIATFPTTPAPPPFLQSEAVPTEVQRGPDGALYVSTLSGAPFLVGASSIYRVVPGLAPTLYAGGFKTVTDFAFAPDGSMYVLEFASGPVFFAGPGQLIQVAPDGTRTTVVQDLPGATSMVVGGDGAIYISINGNLSGAGKVLRYDP
jgi:hypothetical protein